MCPWDGKKIPSLTHLPHSNFPSQFSRACHKCLLHIQCTVKSPASAHGYFKLMLKSQFCISRPWLCETRSQTELRNCCRLAKKYLKSLAPCVMFLISLEQKPVIKFLWPNDMTLQKWGLVCFWGIISLCPFTIKVLLQWICSSTITKNERCIHVWRAFGLVAVSFKWSWRRCYCR